MKWTTLTRLSRADSDHRQMLGLGQELTEGRVVLDELITPY